MVGARWSKLRAGATICRTPKCPVPPAGGQMRQSRGLVCIGFTGKYLSISHFWDEEGDHLNGAKNHFSAAKNHFYAAKNAAITCALGQTRPREGPVCVADDSERFAVTPTGFLCCGPIPQGQRDQGNRAKAGNSGHLWSSKNENSVLTSPGETEESKTSSFGLNSACAAPAGRVCWVRFPNPLPW
jgi:hypothetical protein